MGDRGGGGPWAGAAGGGNAAGRGGREPRGRRSRGPFAGHGCRRARAGPGTARGRARGVPRRCARRLATHPRRVRDGSCRAAHRERLAIRPLLTGLLRCGLTEANSGTRYGMDRIVSPNYRYGPETVQLAVIAVGTVKSVPNMVSIRTFAPMPQ